MLNLTAANERNERINFGESEGFVITNITGLDPIPANINFTEFAVLDGGVFNSATVGKRNIVIDVAINNPLDTNRIALYNFFQPKKEITLRISNDTRNVSIDGYVESVECGIFSQLQTAQISVLCPNPYFKGTTITKNIVDGETINYDGDEDCGMVFAINFAGATENLYIELDDEITTYDFGVEYSFNSGGTLRISTIDGNKYVDYYSTSILGALSANSKWLKLKHGSNTLTFGSDSGSISNISITYTPLYGGV